MDPGLLAFRKKASVMEYESSGPLVLICTIGEHILLVREHATYVPSHCVSYSMFKHITTIR